MGRGDSCNGAGHRWVVVTVVMEQSVGGSLLLAAGLNI